ncbi:hypothetical protein [Paucidesulfovibrio longus]|uniref:hypothetical protein n=1 Tax=Paucidesulfovibrio longus TaxID=889 RepID=UPI000411F855|nr:hypothetical protein [Paucidesulfovibrio longus]
MLSCVLPGTSLTARAIGARQYVAEQDVAEQNEGGQADAAEQRPSKDAGGGSGKPQAAGEVIIRGTLGTGARVMEQQPESGGQGREAQKKPGSQESRAVDQPRRQ